MPGGCQAARFAGQLRLVHLRCGRHPRRPVRRPGRSPGRLRLEGREHFVPQPVQHELELLGSGLRRWWMAVEQGDPGMGALEAQLFLRTTCSRLGNTFIAGAGVLLSQVSRERALRVRRRRPWPGAGYRTGERAQCLA